MLDVEYDSPTRRTCPERTTNVVCQCNVDVGTHIWILPVVTDSHIPTSSLAHYL